MAVAAVALAAAMAAGPGGGAWLRRLAGEAGLPDATVVDGAGHGEGATFTASGFGGYEAVEDFVARVERTATVERLALTAIAAKPTALATADPIRWEAVVRMGARPAVRKAGLLDPLRAFALEFDPQDVGLTEAVLGDTFHVSGYKLLPGPGAYLLPILEAAGLELSDSSITRDGACDRFEVLGRVARKVAATVPDESRQPPRPGRLFDDGALCAMDATPAPPALVQGGAAGEGPLTLRLRDLDPAELVNVLHQATGESFVVGEDVTRRVALEMAGVEAEDVLHELVVAGLRASPPGRLRVVSAGEPVAPERRSGDPVSLSFTHADLRDVLRLFQDISGRELLAPDGDLGRVSVFVREVPWDEVLFAIAARSGLTVRLDGEQGLLVERDAHAGPPAPAAEDAVRRGVRLRRRGIPPRTDGVVAEIGCWNLVDAGLTGLTRVGADWSAVIHRGDGLMVVVRPGYEFCDGRLTAVDGDGITLRRGKALMRVPLPPP